METHCFSALQYMCNQFPSAEICGEVSVKAQNPWCGLKILHDLIPTSLPSLIYWSSFSDSPRPFYKLLQILQSPSCLIIFTHMVPSTWNILPYITHLGNFYSSFRSQLKCHFLKEVFFEIPNQVRFYILTALILFLHNIYYNCIHIISLLLICSISVFP